MEDVDGVNGSGPYYSTGLFICALRVRSLERVCTIIC